MLQPTFVSVSMISRQRQITGKISGGGENHRPLSTIAISTGGTYIASGDNKGIVVIHDKDDKYRQILKLSHDGPILKLDFSPDGESVGSPGQEELKKTVEYGIIQLWNTENWEPKKEPKK